MADTKLVLLVLVVWMLGCKQHAVESPSEQASEPFGSLELRLQGHVQMLAGTIGARNLKYPKQLEAASSYIQRQWEGMGYRVEREVIDTEAGNTLNLYVEVEGKSKSWLVVGAHYDSCGDTPGADDNASGVAALLELSRRFQGQRLAHPLRLVAFANEEPPWFQTEQMGSLVHARACKKRGEKLLGMIALEMLGFYCDDVGSQEYPIPALAWLYPKKGNFIAFVTNLSSADFMRRPLKVFKKACTLPAQAMSAPEAMTGIGFSDHWSFWQAGYRAFMVTDTAFFRNPHYHETSDQPVTLDYVRFTKAVEGIGIILADLVQMSDER